MYDGTLASVGPWQALVTFQQLIILGGKTGIVDMTPDAISRRTTIPIEVIRVGLDALEKPDPDSRTPDEDGRRIVLLSDGRSWGWRIVNHDKYAKLRSEEERREYHRQYAKKRDPVTGLVPNAKKAKKRRTLKAVESNTSQQNSNDSTHTDTDTDTDILKPKKKTRTASTSHGWIDSFRADWHERYGGTIGMAKVLRALLPLVEQHNASEVQRRWRIYLNATDGKFASASRFAETFGSYREPPKALNGTNGTHASTASEGGAVFAKIRSAIVTVRNPGQPASVFIRPADVDALGPSARRAYDAVGGAARFIAAEGKELGYLLRDFEHQFTEDAKAGGQGPPLTDSTVDL